ncbi:MAG: copper chaperone PCu(A)C [Pseudomonadota bacterium]
MKSFIAAAALAALTAVPAFAADLMAKDPFAYATAASARAGGAYISLQSHGAADRLIDVRSDVAKRVEIHEHQEDDGVMRMRQVKAGLPLPAGGTIEMAPGGYHIMLMGLNAPLELGASFPVTLVFESGTELVVEVPVKARGAYGQGGHGESGHGAHETKTGHGDHGEGHGDKAAGHAGHKKKTD